MLGSSGFTSMSHHLMIPPRIPYFSTSFISVLPQSKAMQEDTIHVDYYRI